MPSLEPDGLRFAVDAPMVDLDGAAARTGLG